MMSFSNYNRKYHAASTNVCAGKCPHEKQPRVCVSSRVTSNNFQRPLLTRINKRTDSRLITSYGTSKQACTQSCVSTLAKSPQPLTTQRSERMDSLPSPGHARPRPWGCPRLPHGCTPLVALPCPRHLLEHSSPAQGLRFLTPTSGLSPGDAALAVPCHCPHGAPRRDSLSGAAISRIAYCLLRPLQLPVHTTFPSPSSQTSAASSRCSFRPPDAKP